MIKSVRSNNPKFTNVEFHNGYNIILADRTKIDNKDDKKQSRNGAGKTTLIEIIHFCLGSSVRKGSIFRNENLKSWSFTLSIEINGALYELTREVDNTGRIYIEGDLSLLNWDLKYEQKSKRYYIVSGNLNRELLENFFGIKEKTNKVKYSPSFRDLISYCIRRSPDGFRDAFEYFPKQKEYSRQCCNAFFLGLNMKYASDFQEIKDKVKGIEDYKKAAKSGVIGNVSLNIGELNTEVITKQKDLEKLKSQLDSFEVYPQYSEISKEADTLTDFIHQINNTLTLRKQLLNKYEQSVKEETINTTADEIEMIYKEAGFLFENNIRRKLEDVILFHQTLIKNRKEYLQSEVEQIRKEISELENNLKSKSDKRAEILTVLKTHGALEEYTKIQERYSIIKQLYEDAKKRLEAAEHVENSKSKLKIENQELLIKSRQDYGERIDVIKTAVSLFKSNTEFLYPEAGTLTIDLKEKGYIFGVDIKNSKSQGVGYMKVFCYDMLLAELGIGKEKHPDFLIHDSQIFDGVDERQIARALMLAKNKIESIGFQYICIMNSDMVPINEFDNEFKQFFYESVVLKLDDKTENGGLLGIRF